MTTTKPYDINQKCSKYFTYREFIQCGETFGKLQIDNFPTQSKTYLAIQRLATEILDPIVDQFGKIELTYGFCSNELKKKIKKNTAPHLDQHTSYELNSRGNRICKRDGFSVDFISRSHNSLKISKWIAEFLPFDCLYYYDKHSPLHVSFSTESLGEIVIVRRNANTKRRMPRVISKPMFLRLAE